MRKKEEGGLSDQPTFLLHFFYFIGLSEQPIREDDEDLLPSSHSNEPFAVRRTKSQKDPHGLEDRDV